MADRESQIGLFFSIFYDRSAWHTLLAAHLKPLAMMINAIDPQSTHVVHFSYAKGVNVGVSWYLTPAFFIQSATVIDEVTKRFLSEKPSKGKRNESNSQALFKDFDTNTIRYNLHQFPLFLHGGLSQNLTAHLVIIITETVYKFLGGQIIDEEGIFTLSFYLHAIIAVRCLTNARAYISIINSSSHNLPAQVDPEACKKYFLNNEVLLREIIADVLAGQVTVVEGELFDVWGIACKEIFESNRKDSGVSDAINFKNISNVVIAQLGMSEAAQQMTFRLLSNCLE